MLLYGSGGSWTELLRSWTELVQIRERLRRGPRARRGRGAAHAADTPSQSRPHLVKDLGQRPGDEWDRDEPEERHVPLGRQGEPEDRHEQEGGEQRSAAEHEDRDRHADE